MLTQAHLSGCVERRLKVDTCRSMCQQSNNGDKTSNESSNESSEEREYAVKQRILKSSLPFVSQYGWTQNALSAGAETEGLPGIAHGLFPKGGIELVFYFYNDCNKRLAEELAEQVKQETEEQTDGQKTGPKIRPFIRNAVETRLRMITPYIEKWPQAMGMMAIPVNAPEALNNLLNLTDEIWYHAGDKSTDFNWYTKRLSLAGVYKSTEIFMVQDKSDDYEDTWYFLDRRMEDLNSIGNIARSSKETGAILTETCKGMMIMARNVLGANSRAK
ncbi:Ubiquinone biosynthesis protein coq9 [Mactra antiquata]